LGANIDKRVDLLLSMAGCIMFLSTGIIIIHQIRHTSSIQSHNYTALTAASLTLLNSLMFAIDTVVIFRS